MGFVKSARDFLVNIEGFPGVKVNDLIMSEKGVAAMVTALFPTEIEAWILSHGEVKPGQLFHRLPNRLEILVGEHFLGRAINPLGLLVDEGNSFSGRMGGEMMELEREASGIASRQFISEQFPTGISVIDLLVPIGKGQRELIVGDTRSGKTAFILDLIVNQKDTNIVCVYGLIGRSMAAVKNTMQILEEKGAMNYTVVVAGFSTDPLPLIYLTPKTAMTVAEFFRKQGKDVLLILDDMGSHAKVYREISLLGNRFPGREAYPGDIFYQHASLLERAGKFSKEAGGGSITAIPVIELDLDDFSSFIPTNLMAMTDGHLLFKSVIYGQGRRPAVDVSLSVSRVGRQTQNPLQNSLAMRIKQTLATADQLASVTGFGGELPSSTQLLLRQKAIIEEFLSQKAWTLITPAEQVVLLGLTYTKFFSDKEANFILQNKDILIGAFRNNDDYIPTLKKVVELKTDAELVAELDKLEPKLKTLLGQADKTEVVDSDTWLPKV